MDNKNDIQVMVQCAKMYYIEKMTQAEIAKKLGVSRSSISVMLSQAMDNGIIEISIKDPYANNDRLSGALKERFGLDDCRVVPINVASEELLVKIVSSQAGLLASEIIKSHSAIGIAWGRTCYEFMQEFPVKRDIYDVNVVPLLGGSNRVGLEYQLNETVRMFAEKLHGSPSFIYAPAIADTIADRALYMQSVYMQSIVEKWMNIGFAVVSAGMPPEQNKGEKPPIALDSMIDTINENYGKAIGDICAFRINIKGEFVNNDYNSRIIGIGEQYLHKVKKVMCIAAGEHKALSVIGALNTKILNYLVIDEKTAQIILEVLDCKRINCLQ
ncbi:MAG: sugar-binding domain-containing protein [Christensenella sp.]|nr:sugar-binding domain-containing protein [Christensenella sp.]